MGMSRIPYPPAPEPGWYDDDVDAVPGVAFPAYGTQEMHRVQAHRQDGQVREQPEWHGEPDDYAGEPDEYMAEPGAEGDAQWDGTVLSKRFAREAEHEAVLTNAVTNQHIDINMNTLLGRKPSHDIPEGSKSVRLIDPTRTVSRNHCAISYGEHGTLWLEDMGSLNGTYVVHDDEEMRVSQGTPVELDLPAHIRIGDQFFTLDAR